MKRTFIFSIVFILMGLMMFSTSYAHHVKPLPTKKPFIHTPKPTKTPKPTATPKPTKKPKATKSPTMSPRATATATTVPTVSPTPTPTEVPQPTTLSFPNVNAGQNSDALRIPEGYKSMTFNVTYDGYLAGFAPQMSFDGGTTFYEQTRFGCGSNCPVVTVPVLGEYYRFSPGSPVEGAIVQVTLNPEPDAKVVLLGQVVSYPFTSDSFSTDGFSTITMTIGPGANPQHVTEYTLERFESGTWTEKERVVCDGGATCQLVTLPVLGGDYRVSLEGNGVEAVVGGIMRK